FQLPDYQITQLPNPQLLNYQIHQCWWSAPALSLSWRSTDQISSGIFSHGYTCTIQPKTWGKKVPPAAAQVSAVDIDPFRPNCGFFLNISTSRPLGGRHMFTCWCHWATLRGMRSLSWSSLKPTGAVYMAPISLYSLPCFS